MTKHAFRDWLAKMLGITVDVTEQHGVEKDAIIAVLRAKIDELEAAKAREAAPPTPIDAVDFKKRRHKPKPKRR